MVSINLIGRLGADAELKTSKNGKQFASLRVATDEFKNGTKGTAWFNVSYANDRAVNIAKFLTKGKMVNVIGSETVSTYQNKNGEFAVSRDILADRIDFVNIGSSGDTSNESSVSTDTGTFKTQHEEVEVAATSAASSAVDDLPF